MLDRYLWPQFKEFLDAKHEMTDSTIDVSLEVDTSGQYPNYSVLPSYASHGSRAQPSPLHRILFGGSVGLMFGALVGSGYGFYKYRRLGYKGIELIDKISYPFLKSVFCATILGIGFGAKEIQLTHNQNN
jgi:hypothetical protein